jgi:hypothetical protein
VILILSFIAILIFAGFKPAAATLAFGSIGLALLAVALQWQHREAPVTVDEEPTGARLPAFRQSASDFLRRMRQRLLSMQEA